jgi:predicted chitinase
MKTNLQTFFTEYRTYFGKISKQQTIDVLSSILEANTAKYNLPLEQLAYLLATAYHETGHDFVPKRELGGSAYFIKKYWTNQRVAKWLGNDDASEAVKYCGRGLVQITGETNYERFGIASNPEMALETGTAIRIIFEGMIKGIFTGKKLSDYNKSIGYDFVNARRIINGVDRAADIAKYANYFLSILKKSTV